MNPIITAITPIDCENQRTIKVNGETTDMVLFEREGVIYINSISREYLQRVARAIGISSPQIMDIQGRERQFDGLSGYILETSYKSLAGGVRSIGVTLQKHDALITILDEVMV